MVDADERASMCRDKLPPAKCERYMQRLSSHGINNPLAAITNLVYLLRSILPEKANNEELHKYLKHS